MSRDLLWEWFPRCSEHGNLDVCVHSCMFDDMYPYPRSYYLFIEEVSAIDNFEGIDAPDGTPLGLSDAKFERPQTRYRASGVAAADFTREMDGFGHLGGGASKSQRDARRKRLLRYFERSPVQLFDIYIDSAEEQGRAIRATLLPTSWHLIVLDTDTGQSGTRRVFQASAGITGGGGHEAARLLSILPVSPPIELRLRDIFSLNHIGDADLDLGGEPGPGGPPDGDPPKTRTGRWVDAKDVPRRWDKEPA